MINIDMIDNRISVSEKPITRTQTNAPSIGTSSCDPVYVLMQSQYKKILEIAQTACLLRSLNSNRVVIDLNRVAEPKRTPVATLAERLTRRTISLIGIG